MRRKSNVSYKKAFGSFQKYFIAQLLLQGNIEEVKQYFTACNVEFSDEVIKELITMYGKTKFNKECK